MFQQTVKNFKINYSALNERATFSSGDTITGNISFDLTKETKITSITLTVTGKANVHWTTGGGKNRSKRHISDKVEYFNYKSVILQRDGAPGGTQRLPPGTHVYPFTCQLPQGDFPSTFHGVRGQIVYSLTVGLLRPWRMSKDFVTEFNFVSRTDTRQPVLHAPLSGSNTMTLCCLWCATGPITMTVSTEKQAFMPGETVKIICDFGNASSRIVTPKVKLRQNQDFYAHNRANRSSIVKSLESLTGQPISPHTTDVHSEMTVTIPSSASVSITNCSILDVTYKIEVSLSPSGGPDLTVLFPIIVCDSPVDPHPPAYQENFVRH